MNTLENLCQKTYLPSNEGLELNSTTLEWMVQSPPAFHTFGELPTIKETKSHVKLKKKRSPIATKNLIELRIVPNKLLGVLLMVS